jgi:hypothetical protein
MRLNLAILRGIASRRMRRRLGADTQAAGVALTHTGGNNGTVGDQESFVSPVGGPSIPVHPPSTNSVLPLT